MKLEKNKIVFIAVIACVVLFIGAYASLMLGEEEAPVIDGNQIPVPKLDEHSQKNFKSKLEALDALKDVRQTNAPSIYDERLLDSTGIYDKDLLKKEKQRIVDSLYNDIRFINAIDDDPVRQDPKTNERLPNTRENQEIKFEPETTVTAPYIPAQELALEHQLFFASDPQSNPILNGQRTDSTIYVRVDGTQTVKKDFRLGMRLAKPAHINGVLYPKNTFVYGFVSFKPNRTIISIHNIDHNQVKLKAFDLQDGNEGVYVENTFRADATREVFGDVVDDVNIAGVPQVTGIKKLFQRNNRNMKVTILDDYQLILKPL
ncbi:conjugative transposon protein TraM [Aestuariivivens insulae]|uniref:conjugative transposon protein TraM n=1 Tax=Aestuariivivens insulae TaxID=1621988 RepID=UPI001F58455D|nr:conjugative transposon protein TraM [Aestuariivivens insulae]